MPVLARHLRRRPRRAAGGSTGGCSSCPAPSSSATTPAASGWCRTTCSSDPERAHRDAGTRDCTGNPARVTFRFVRHRRPILPRAHRLSPAARAGRAARGRCRCRPRRPHPGAADLAGRRAADRRAPASRPTRSSSACSRRASYAAAVEQARAVVDLAERAEPAGAEELQVALMNLGLAERTAGDYVAAEASYQRAIALIEGTGRLASPRSRAPTPGSRSPTTPRAATTSPRPASSARSRCSAVPRACSTRSSCRCSSKQADALTELGRAEEALQAHRYALRLVGRRSGEHSLRYARELESLRPLVHARRAPTSRRA